MHPNTLVVIEVRGGIVQEVYTNLELKVVLVDWDNIASGDSGIEYGTESLGSMSKDTLEEVEKAFL